MLFRHVMEVVVTNFRYSEPSFPVPRAVSYRSYRSHEAVRNPIDRSFARKERTLSGRRFPTCSSDRTHEKKNRIDSPIGCKDAPSGTGVTDFRR